jgi:hypothetical protein
MPLLAALAAGLVIVSVVIQSYVRSRRVNRLRTDAHRPHGTLRSHGTASHPQDDGALHEGTAMALSVPGLALWELSKIDPDVIDGISQASSVSGGVHDVPDTYAGFLGYVHERGDALLSDGAFNRLAGYVGEQRVQGLLEAQGAQIEMATTANNPGWDLLVNGQAANVKTYQDASDAVQYARANPDTDYYLPEDAAHPAVAPNITYLEGFNGGDVRDSLHESLDAAQSLTDGTFVADAAFPGVPVLLIAMTAYKQRTLVKEGKRLEDAIKDGALDVGARTVGALAGLKAGAAAGAMVDGAAGGATLGAGTVVGSLAGAVAGSKLGGWVVNEYRLGPVRAAEARMFEELQEYGLALAGAGGLEVLDEAIYAPVNRTQTACNDLEARVAADRRSLRWWLWPGADQVLRESALAYAEDDLGSQLEGARRHEKAWADLLQTENGAAALGLTFANIPELAAQVAGADDYVQAIEIAKANADQARREYRSRL